MITNLRPYTATRDTSVPWIGAVPKHWQIRRLGSLLRERGETNSDGQEYRVLSVLSGRGVIPYAEKGNVGNKKSEDITRYKIVRLNDIVVNSMNVIIGSVGLSRYLGCLSPVYYVLTRRSVYDNPRYLDALFQVIPFQKSLVRIGNGILAHRMRIPMELLKCENFPHPPHDEQTAIVCFLDHINHTIQRLISAKRKLITLLEEQKFAMIHHAVTRGLDPNVRLKPSGIESLGDIPRHWEVRRLKDIGELVAGSGFPHNYQGNTNEKLPFYKVGDLVASSDGHLMKEAPNTVSREVATDLRARLIPQNSIVYAKIGAALLLNRRRITSRPCCIDNNMTAYIPNRQKSTTAWSYYWTFTIDFSQFVSPGAVPSISEGAQGRIPFLVPTLAEQSKIASFLDGKIADIDATIASVRHGVELLREYRTRLTADVVTGKLDVREIADRLPVDSSSPEKQAAIADVGEQWVDSTNTCSEGSET